MALEQTDHLMKTGTTTVAIMCKDGVVLAADKRATAGFLIAQKSTEKIQTITDNISVTMAGTVSDAQLLIRVAQAELKLKQLRTMKDTNVKEAANLFGRLVYSNIRKFSTIPGVSHFIMGGKDEEGFHIYDIFADGSISEIKDFVSSGSGSVLAYGVLETLYKKDSSVADGIKLAVKSVNAALQRDIASGNGIDVVTITKEGMKKVMEKELSVKLEA